MKWQRYDTVYYSGDDRFCIIKATNRVHVGDWELYDSKTSEYCYKPTLKECKHIAENIANKTFAQGKTAKANGIKCNCSLCKPS